MLDEEREFIKAFNEYTTTYGKDATNKEEADRQADRGRLACIKVEIDCEEGEGL
jgi:hypothetical protein